MTDLVHLQSAVCFTVGQILHNAHYLYERKRSSYVSKCMRVLIGQTNHMSVILLGDILKKECSAIRIKLALFHILIAKKPQVLPVIPTKYPKNQKT